MSKDLYMKTPGIKDNNITSFADTLKAGEN